MNFGMNLALVRKQNGMSQEDLAFTLGISRQTLYTWEADLSYPNVIMLKKISQVLRISIDDLVMGPDVFKLPKTLPPYEILLGNETKVTLDYLEVPNWFIRLEEGNEVSFGLYDSGKRDYSYHLLVGSKISIHGEEGFEILVEEYNEKQQKESSYSLIARNKNSKISFLGKLSTENGMKKIETFKDDQFLHNWGSGEKKDGDTTHFEDATICKLKYGDNEYSVYRLVNAIDPDLVAEVFLNQGFETLLWRRFLKNHPSKISLSIEQEKYGLEYECITDRVR